MPFKDLKCHLAHSVFYHNGTLLYSRFSESKLWHPTEFSNQLLVFYVRVWPPMTLRVWHPMTLWVWHPMTIRVWHPMTLRVVWSRLWHPIVLLPSSTGFLGLDCGILCRSYQLLDFWIQIAALYGTPAINYRFSRSRLWNFSVLLLSPTVFDITVKVKGFRLKPVCQTLQMDWVLRTNYHSSNPQIFQDPLHILHHYSVLRINTTEEYRKDSRTPSPLLFRALPFQVNWFIQSLKNNNQNAVIHAMVVTNRS